MVSLSVFDNMTLRSTFGPREENNRSWKKLHHTELQSVVHNYIDIKCVRTSGEGGYEEYVKKFQT
jgi:hypothetical protein